MRSALILAAGCLLFLSGAGVASSQQLVVVKMSKADVDQATFAQDRNACLTKANSEHLFDGRDEGTWARHHLKAFGECMAAKGYKNDPNGFPALKYSQDGRAHIFVEAL